MGVKLRVHPILQQSTAGREMVEATGETIGECLDDLERQFPGIKQRLCDEQVRLFSFYEIYVNSDSSYPEELAKRIQDGDEITIAVALGGG